MQQATWAPGSGRGRRADHLISSPAVPTCFPDAQQSTSRRRAFPACTAAVAGGTSPPPHPHSFPRGLQGVPGLGSASLPGSALSPLEPGAGFRSPWIRHYSLVLAAKPQPWGPLDCPWGLPTALTPPPGPTEPVREAERRARLLCPPQTVSGRPGCPDGQRSLAEMHAVTLSYFFGRLVALLELTGVTPRAARAVTRRRVGTLCLVTPGGLFLWLVQPHSEAPSEPSAGAAVGVRACARARAAAVLTACCVCTLPRGCRSRQCVGDAAAGLRHGQDVLLLRPCR